MAGEVQHLSLTSMVKLLLRPVPDLGSDLSNSSLQDRSAHFPHFVLVSMECRYVHFLHDVRVPKLEATNALQEHLGLLLLGMHLAWP